MKIFNLATFTALFAIAYSKGSKGGEPSQLIGKAGGDSQSDLKHALVCIMYVYTGRCIGGGALLSSETVIVPMIIFATLYRGIYYKPVNFRAAIGLNSFDSAREECLYHVDYIIENLGPNEALDNALALVIIKSKSERGNSQPSWVPHIPLATQSYMPGKHTVSEFVVVWNKDMMLEKNPICHVSTEYEGTISANIPVPYDEDRPGHLFSYLGGFITRKGTLAGLAVSHRPVRNGNEPVKFFFLPVNGNHPLFTYFKDQGIQILDVDSLESCVRGEISDEGSSNIG